MHNAIVRTGCLLEEVGRQATGIAAAMLAARTLMMTTSLGRNVVLHANHAIIMVMVGNNRHYQHNHADEKQEISNVPFLFHSSIFDGRQR